MKTILFTILILAVLHTAGFSQTALPPDFEIKSDTAYLQEIDTAHWQMLEDKTGKLTIEDVTALPLSEKFHRRGIELSGIDTNVNTYWFRYVLKNAMSHDARIALNSMSDYDDFYLFDSIGTWKKFISGGSAEKNKKDGFKSNNAIPLVLQPKEEHLVYQRIQNNKAGLKSTFSIGIEGTDKVLKQDYIDFKDEGIHFEYEHLAIVFMLGTILITAIFNLFFFGIVKEKVYLYFSLFILCLGLSRIQTLLIPKGEYNYDDHKIINVLGGMFFCASFFFLVHFFRTGFQTSIKFPKWDKFLKFFSSIYIFSAIIIFSQIFSKELFWPLWRITVLPLFILLIITSTLYLKSKDKFHRSIQLTSLPFILFGLIQILSGSFFSSAFVYFSLETVCILWFTIFFAYNLLQRYNLLQKENAQKSIDNERLAKEKEIERNQLIEAQKMELEIQVEKRTNALSLSLKELKATQNQLIQSEKLASLGELTAGIAHEIQNPLNFVNNFSELSVNLAKDIKDEIHKPEIDKPYLEDLLKDLTENQKNINHHGKRAASIVSGMLEHSRASTGKKEFTDVNKLCDEYFRLSYHGLRAKNKDFNAEMITNFDTTIPKIEIIPQDVGRVILNLINNAFYAVNEKRILDDGQRTTDNGKKYQPTVTVSTKKLDNAIEIRVKDNGTGMSEPVRAKVFQPFFTTKPTGQGTGLGLSLAYDIITKGHGGELKVESTEGVGSEFIVVLSKSK